MRLGIASALRGDDAVVAQLLAGNGGGLLWPRLVQGGRGDAERAPHLPAHQRLHEAGLGAAAAAETDALAAAPRRGGGRPGLQREGILL